MRLLLQRVTRAEVRVDHAVVGSIGPGLLVFVGIGHGDTPQIVGAMVDKTLGLRIFRDEGGRTNRSLVDVAGELLAVSQFTLYADTRKGRRPSFLDAAPPDLGDGLYRAYADAVAARGITVARGVFGAEMAVDLVNDGPFTIWLDSAG
ncbi:MAG: D-tyrosyl-tRNA(Tyr) deacylase [Chloroflexi bacterium]|nr:D-tyrosyl-tRNA(Tyr) deacylase [Chloroflexota bacterium]